MKKAIVSQCVIMPLNVYDLTDNVNATAKKISKCFEKPAQNCTLLYSNAKSFIFLLHFIGDILMATKTSLTPPTILRILAD